MSKVKVFRKYLGIKDFTSNRVFAKHNTDSKRTFRLKSKMDFELLIRKNLGSKIDFFF